MLTFDFKVVELKEKEENNTKIQIQKGKRLPAEQEKRHIPSSTQSSEVSVSSDNGKLILEKL